MLNEQIINLIERVLGKRIQSITDLSYGDIEKLISIIGANYNLTK